MPCDIAELIINPETLLKLPPQVRKGPFDLLVPSMGTIAPHKFLQLTEHYRD
jgi:hypothetical protein